MCTYDEDDSLNCAAHWDNRAPLACTAMFFRNHDVALITAKRPSVKRKINRSMLINIQPLIYDY